MFQVGVLVDVLTQAFEQVFELLLQKGALGLELLQDDWRFEAGWLAVLDLLEAGLPGVILLDNLLQFPHF